MAAYARQGRHSSARAASSRSGRPAARRSPRSPTGNASGSLRPRIETYCAVQGPTPGKPRRRSASAGLSPSSVSPPAATADARARIAAARCLVSPARSRGASARSCGVGNVHASVSVSLRSLVPNIRVTRPTSAAAPATDACWPMIARTPISNGSQPPGSRNPGRRRTRERSSGSDSRCARIACGSASTSNIARTRLRIVYTA
jgi:hypothetical protein